MLALLVLSVAEHARRGLVLRDGIDLAPQRGPAPRTAEALYARPADVRHPMAFLQLHAAPEADVSDEVSKERGEDIQIHDGFGQLESADADEAQKIKKNKDLQALMQMRARTSPDVSDDVARERGEDIQIHDGFGQLESDDADSEKKIKKNKDLQALMQMRARTSPDVSDEVTRERGEDIQIHDGFGQLESDDTQQEQQIKKNKDLQAFLQEEPESSQQALRSGGSTAVEGETETFSGSMDGQKEDGGKAVEMLEYILTETETERGTATSTEATNLETYDDEMTRLTGEESTLLTDHDTYTANLAAAEQSLEETNEDDKATTRERDAIEAFLEQIEPQCTFMQDHHTARTSNRAAEKAALQGAITTLQGTPAFQTANSTYVSPLA